MARKQFTIQYPDGSKAHVKDAEFQRMHLRGELRQIDAKRYHFVGVFVSKALRCKGFDGLSVLRASLSPTQFQRYLESLEVIFAQALEREWQAEETPNGFYQRLKEMGMPADGFSA